MSDNLYIGLMSGTSLDGIDAVLVDFSTTPPNLISSHIEAIAPLLRAELLALSLPGDNEIDRMGEVDSAFADNQVKAIQALLVKTDIDISQVKAIGSHGQTIRHRPNFQRPFTLQIGDPNRMAEQLNCTVVADFRRRDMAAGGEGAPLVPAFHEWLFQVTSHHRMVINIGGIANVTVLDRDQSIEALGYDTGPGNVLMDYWTQTHLDQPCDLNGQWADSGQCHPQLLEQLMETAYLKQAYPKSTGRELFNGPWLEQQLQLLATDVKPADVQTTLLEFTARTIAQAVQQHKLEPLDIFICGGGADNPALMARLRALLTPHRVSRTDELGIPSAWLEACAFAWLAKQCLEAKPGNLPAVTGAKGRRILGAIYQA